jgi:hypothetical protein
VPIFGPTKAARDAVLWPPCPETSLRSLLAHRASPLYAHHPLETGHPLHVSPGAAGSKATTIP